MKKKTLFRECSISIQESEDGFIATCEELDIECFGATPEEALEEIRTEITSMMDEQGDFEVLHDSLLDRLDVTIFPIPQVGDA